MSRRGRSLSNQSNYAVSQIFRPGRSKRADKLNRRSVPWIYANKSCSRIRDLSNTLCRFLRTNFPEVKLLKEIQPKMIQAFVDERFRNLSPQSRIEYESRLKKLQAAWSYSFGINDVLNEVNFPEAPDKLEKIRVNPMTQEDFDKLNNYLSNSRSKAKYIPSLILMTAARLEEVTSININEDLRFFEDCVQIDLKNCKNGRNRTVTIHNQDHIEKLKLIINYCQKQGWNKFCGNLKPNSVSASIRRSLERLNLKERYPNQGAHSIRKLAARKCFCEQLGIPFKDLKIVELDPKDNKVKIAFQDVQTILGHGPRFRPELFKAYILGE